MESEKVKEIKKALECCKQNEIENTCEYCSNCPASDWDYEKECNIDLFQKTLTLINELESDKDNLYNLNQNLISDKQVLMHEYERLVEQRNKTYNIWVKDTEKLKDRIAELEKENEDYYDRLNNLQTYIDNHEEIWKGNTNNALKQFAERLKEQIKATAEWYDDRVYKCYNGIMEKDIDETLKEVLK